MTQVKKRRKQNELKRRPIQRSRSKRHRIGFEKLEERLVLDALGFDLRVDRTDYVIGETVQWETWVSLSDVRGSNFGIHTASFDLAEDRSERMSRATIGSAFSAYTLPSGGSPGTGSLRSVGAGQFGYDAAVVRVTAAEPGPTMFAQGSFIVRRAGTHTLSLTPGANQFFAVNSGFRGTYYDSLVGDSESFVVVGSTAPTVRLSVDTSEMSEAGGLAFVEARLSTALDQDVKVDLGFSGTATKGEDYTSSTQIVITAGNLRSTSQLTAVQDQLVEDNETIVVDVVAVDNAVEAGTQQVTVSVVDDDDLSSPLDTLRFDLQTDKTNYVTGELVQWQVLVFLENPSENFGIHTVSFDLTENRSETMDQATFSPEFADYALHSTGLSGAGSLQHVSARQLDFDAGVVEVTAAAQGPTLLSTGSFTLTSPGAHSLLLTPDTSRFFSVNTGNSLEHYGSLVGDSVSFDVEAGTTPAVLLHVDNLEIAESEGGVATLTAELSHASNQDVTVDLAFSGTATKLVDYSRSSAQIVIEAGNLSGTAQVKALNDAFFDPSETVFVEIIGVTNGVEAGQQQLTIVVIDSAPPRRDTLVFELETDKKRYAVSDTVHWSTYVSLQNASSTNFGIRTVSFNLNHSRSEDLKPATVSYAFGNYEFGNGRVSGRSLRDVRADLDTFYPGIVQVTGESPEPTLLASGTFSVTGVGYHSLTLRPQDNNFFTVGLNATTQYAALIPATVSFVVDAGSSGNGGGSNGQGGSGNSSGDGVRIGDTIVGDGGEPIETARLPTAQKNGAVTVDEEFFGAEPLNASRGDNRSAIESSSTIERHSSLLAALTSWSDDDLATALVDLGAITDALD